MATAAKSISVAPIGMEPAMAPVPGAVDLFATLVAGMSGEGETASGEDGASEATVSEPGQEEAIVDASVLLPMLDQQRAAAPVPTLVATPAENPLPTIGKRAAPVMDVATEKAAPVPGPVPLDGKATPLPIETGSAAGPTPIMRPLKASEPEAMPDAVPVMRPIAPEKAVADAGKREIPIMRPGPDMKKAEPAPVMPNLSVKADTGTATGKAPVMPVLPAELAKVVMPSTPALAASQPLPAPGPGAADMAPKPVVVRPSEIQPATPAIVSAASDIVSAPVAKARTARLAATTATPGISTEAALDPAVTATTETRAAVQPVSAAPTLVQPLGTPLAMPTQNVAAALSQQVLDMSGGDRWIDQIARDISQTAGKDGAMRFRLAPETLGELKVEITHSERGAHVRLQASSEAAQQLLAAAEPKLAAEARAQGVRLAETEIAFSGGQSRDASAQAQTNAREHGQPQSQPQRGSRAATATDTFTSSVAAPQGRGRTDRYA